MMRRILAAAFGVLLMGGVGFPAASAHGPPAVGAAGHEPEPGPISFFPESQCTVLGQVSLRDGISDVPAHNHFTFNSVTLTCDPDTGKTPPALPGGLHGAFNVNAAGGSDGPDHLKVTDPSGKAHWVADLVDGGDDGVTTSGVDHGEECNRGWSHSSEHGPDPTDGDISAVGTPGSTVDGVSANNKQATGWVNFTRVGINVTAWGELSYAGPPAVTIPFLANLQFTPQVLPENDMANTVLACAGQTPNQNNLKADKFDLNGAAVVRTNP